MPATLINSVGFSDLYSVLDPKSRNDRIRVGATVVAVYYAEQQPHYVCGKITSSRPFELECSDAQVADLGPEQRLMLVFEGDQGVSRAVTTITSVRPIDGGFRILADAPKWEQLDKRSYPRYDRRIPAKVRTAFERDGETEMLEIDGSTENIGLGGAWIRSDGAVPKGNLVEVKMDLGHGTVVRVLGVAVRTEDRSGFAVQFLDFIGTARHHLHNYLNAA